jgi:tetratricopeptide (TPR) repeat protein
VEEFRTLLTKDARSLNHRFDCSVALRMLGVAYAELGNDKDATQVYEEASKLAQQLVDSNPDVTAYKTQLAVLSMNLGSNYEAREQWELAEEAWSQALRLERELRASSQDDLDVQGDVVACLSALGDLAARRDDSDAAKKFLKEAIPMLKVLVEQNPRNEWFQDQLQQLEERIAELNP